MNVNTALHKNLCLKNRGAVYILDRTYGLSIVKSKLVNE